MKKLLSLLLLLTGLSGSLYAQNDDNDVFYDASEQLILLSLETSDGNQTIEKYGREELEKFTLFKHLFEDLEYTNETIPLNIKESLPTHFAELVALANGQQTELSDAMLNDARENPEYLKHLFLLAIHLDPTDKKVLYPITVALLNNPSIMTNQTDLTIAVLDNFVELINEPVIHIFRVQSYIRTILATDYLKNSLTNRQARLLISGIKKQAVAIYDNEKLYQRINMYLYDKPLNTYKDIQPLFPIVPGTLLGSRPKPGQFPISTKDVVDLMHVTVQDKNDLPALDLSANRITSIDPETFKNMPNFEWLDLSGNQISSIQADNFINLGNITSLSLNYNILTVLSADVFSKTPLLEALFLQNNQLQSLALGTFSDLRRLEIVNVSNNRLATLTAGTFSNLPALEVINLSDNQLQTIEQGTFTNVPLLQSIILLNNQLQVTKEQIRAENPLPDNCTIFITLEDYNNPPNENDNDDAVVLIQADDLE